MDRCGDVKLLVMRVTLARRAYIGGLANECPGSLPARWMIAQSLRRSDDRCRFDTPCMLRQRLALTVSSASTIEHKDSNATFELHAHVI